MGTMLHRLYFDNLTPTPLDTGSALAQAMNSDFGSKDAWWEDAKATALSTMGWCVTTLNMADGKLHNYLLTEHHIGYPAMNAPIIVIDSWEHAFALDYGTARAKYLDAALKNLNWKTCAERFDQASHCAMAMGHPHAHGHEHGH
jgi:Fe-Mn family superoxide dismutase